MKNEKTRGGFSLLVRRAFVMLVCLFAGIYANAQQCDGCNLFFAGDYEVQPGTTHRYWVTNWNDNDPYYGQWVVFNCEVVDYGMDTDGEPYVDILFDVPGTTATITFGDASPGYYQYGEYDIVVDP
jgi:hypothetical protein